MIAFHGDPAVKQMYLARVAAHEAADEIIKGRYWERGKGCAIGCTIHSGKHASYESELGLPEWLARLEDGLFEALPNGEAKAFPARFLTAIPIGADVFGVRDQFLAWLMDDPTYGLAHHAREPEVKQLAAEVGLRLRTGHGISGPEAEELTGRLLAARAARAAWDARAAWAAWDARAAWAEWAARAEWAAWAARDARDAWAARAARDARDAFVIASAEELLRLLAAAPVGVGVSPHQTP